MGYEVKIFVVRHRPNQSLCADGWCQVLGSLDLSKIGDGDVMNCIIKYHKEQANIPKKNKYFFYDNYGNREFKVCKDKYDEYMPLIPIQEFFYALLLNNDRIKKNQDYGGAGYRRFDVAISLIEPFVKSDQWKSELEDNYLYIMAWGH
jgi:hypothetical protein